MIYLSVGSSSCFRTINKPTQNILIVSTYRIIVQKKKTRQKLLIKIQRKDCKHFEKETLKSVKQKFERNFLVLSNTTVAEWINTIHQKLQVALKYISKSETLESEKLRGFCFFDLGSGDKQKKVKLQEKLDTTLEGFINYFTS